MAVGELRRRKRRGGKPFAVMVRDLATARELAVVDDGAAQLLTGIRRSGNLGGEPIVTDDTDALQRLAQLADGQGLAAAVVVGELVALHWDWLCDVVSPEQRDAIERRNVEQVHAVNAQVLNA